MANEAPAKDPDEDDTNGVPQTNGAQLHEAQKPANSTVDGNDDEEEEEEEENDDEEDDDDDEPRLKYAPLTKNLGSVYRDGDSTSTFLVGGDKMIIGTHDGKTHVLSLPSLQSLYAYRAHSATISSISISPFPPPPPSVKPEAVTRLNSYPNPSTPPKPVSSPGSSPRAPKKQPSVPATPSNSIYIATSSIDGHVCVSSLVDPRDVTLRNFGRPLLAVALSMDYRRDRSYISGGLAGSLVLTTGGKVGASENSSTNPLGGGAVAAASTFLGNLGLGSNTGKDTVLHSGEGAISTIKWSLSGRYVLWVNEQGIKIMRANLLLESGESDFAWKRISHIDRPNRPGWEEMARVWKPRAEWINEDALELDDESDLETRESHTSSEAAGVKTINKKSTPTEKVVVGWGETIWIINVYPYGKDPRERKAGRAEVGTILRTDCIVSGVSLYTPKLLLVLAYMTPEDISPEKKPDSTPRRGIHNALEPELRLIDIETKEEVSADTLTVSRFEILSASDYHLGVLPTSVRPVVASQKGALETFGTGLWDSAMYPARIFNSGASVRSSTSGDKKAGSKRDSDSGISPVVVGQVSDQKLVTYTEGMKIFIQSKYDCVIAVKRDMSDRLTWLDEHHQYQQAWELIDEHPEAVTSLPPETSETPRTPTHTSTLADFFGDNSSQSTLAGRQASNSAAEKEKRRIGELWLDQLVNEGDWQRAGEVCGKVLGTSSRWEHWIWKFAQNGRIEAISPYIPVETTPPLPSLVYEVILGHYVSRDRQELNRLLDIWPVDLYDISSIITAIEDQLRSDDVTEDLEDWRILLECLAKLLLANGSYRDALRCYIRIQDADTAMNLVKEHHLLDAVADDIPGFILLRVSKSQQQNAPIDELQYLTSEPLDLLVDEALHGVVQPETVVDQLQVGKYFVYLYFYFRALWQPEDSSKASSVKTSEGRTIVEQFADTAVELFADYDRPLLMTFLHASVSYTFSQATSVCEKRHYIPELVYLLSKTGEMKRALFLIIDELGDVTQAINFVKEQNDPDLWDDLLDYSMDKPQFIRALLSEVGTAIDPITLVRRIPSGLEIEGLRDGLIKMIREYDIQSSISQGVARVLEGEVAVGMDVLRSGRNRGIKFDIIDDGVEAKRSSSAAVVQAVEGSSDGNGTNDNNNNNNNNGTEKPKSDKEKPGHCAGCGRVIVGDDTETLVGFACGHVYHLSHLDGDTGGVNDSQGGDGRRREEGDEEEEEEEEPSSPSFARTVGPKVTHAFMLKERIGDGCRICIHNKDMDNS